MISCLLLNKSVFSKLFSPPEDYATKINLIGVLLLHTMVFNFTVIKTCFTVCNDDSRSVTSGIVLLLLLLFLNMFILVDTFLDKLRFIALSVIIFFVVVTQQALSLSFNRKAFLKSLFRSFCLLSICHAIRIGVFQLTWFISAPSHGLESTLITPIFALSIWVLFWLFATLSLT